MIDQSLPLLAFGGPYSNLQATHAMRDEAARRGIPPCNVICTGDVVAYAAEPEATVDLIRDWGITVVAGNCEEQLADGADDCGCGFEVGSACDLLSRGWYPYALAMVRADQRQWMAGLAGRCDLDYGGKRIAVLHGGASRNNRFVFASERDALATEFSEAAAARPCEIVVAGHAGIPFVAELDGGLWVNAGVIGLSANDGTPDVWYAIIDADGAEETGVQISLHRLAYDFRTAAANMRRAGHANGYARTIITGVWPSHDVLPAMEHSATGIFARGVGAPLSPGTAGCGVNGCCG